ncbi:MAG TPA: UDP-N-acetylmuramoyl-tripeptide--D-alanyl-D-alanine ligase [Myxococcota bacterium]|nr:UDP-N-acetylmuramoyl-tripeptide--D-alanyl-D-alanine ligase [Myxococcota bacterium]
MTIPFRASDVVRWCGGALLSGDGGTRFDGVSIDSRAVRAGQLFVAIRGPRHDAHAFLADAARARAAGLLVSRGAKLPLEAAALLAIAVDDTTQALGALAAGHRADFEGPVVAITGSNGKTTTKEMCAAIFASVAPCLRTRGNLNNEFGLPLTLLEREASHRSVVVELGMNHRGEIARLAEIARPTVGVLTNVGTAHIEFLGSRDEIAREKGDLLAALAPAGVAVVNADDSRALAQAERTRARVLRFGFSEAADVRAERVTSLGERGYAFDLVAPDGRQAVHVAGLGEATVPNALAAAAAALAGGCSAPDVAAGLAAYEPIGGRMERVALPRNIIVINDTYNANPQSVEQALRSLARLRGSSRGVAVLGDMGELGEASEAAHRAAGRLVAELGLDFLFALGPRAGETADGALEAGMDPSRVHVGSDHESLGASIRELLRGNDWVLVKGSRSMRMERVVEVLARAGGGG